jgi:hypothetical protein
MEREDEFRYIKSPDFDNIQIYLISIIRHRVC